VSLRNNKFLPLLNKEQNFEIYNPASSDQGKYMKYVISPWFPLEAALSILNVNVLCQEQFFLRRNKKQWTLSLIPNHTPSKKSAFERSVLAVQEIVMSQTDLTVLIYLMITLYVDWDSM
jgi:hypothetical protein